MEVGVMVLLAAVMVFLVMVVEPVWAQTVSLVVDVRTARTQMVRLAVDVVESVWARMASVVVAARAARGQMVRRVVVAVLEAAVETTKGAWIYKGTRMIPVRSDKKPKK